MSEQNAIQSEGAPIPGEVSVETLAREIGWVPPEEYEGREGRDPLTAAEFLRKGHEIRGSMKSRLEKMSGELSTVKDAMSHLTEHYEKKTKAEVAKVREELQTKKTEAIEEGDVDAVAKVDQELDALRQEESQPAKKETAGKSDVFVAWEAKNDWYGHDMAMSVVAEAAAAKYHKANPTAPEAQILEHAAATVKKEFVHKFQAPPNSPVEGAKPGGGKGGKKYTEANLSSEQQQIMNTMLRAGAPITKEQYIADLVATGELK